MFKTIMIKELKEIIASPKFVFSFAICSILIILTFYAGAKNYQVNKLQYDASVAENIRSMSGITDWRMVNHKIFLPPQPLSSLVSGVSNDIGRNIQMYGRGELNPTDSKFNEDPIYAVFHFLDLNFLFQIILSLFAILFCYNAVNGEKERGTLRLIFSNALPRDKFILGKISGSTLALTLPLAIPFLIGSMLMLIMNIPLTGGDWIKLILIILTGILLYAVFINLSVFMSTMTKIPTNSFLLLLVFWIFFVLVIPKVSILIAGRAVNVPSVDEINSKKSRYSQQLNKEHFSKLNEFKAPEGANVMTEFQKYMEKLNKDRDEKMRSYTGKLNTERRNRQDIQENLAFALSRVSPSAGYSLIASNLAGSSLLLEKNYREQADSYQKSFAKFQEEKTGMTTGGGMMMIYQNSEDEKPPEINPNELPEFNFEPASVGQSISESLIDIGILMIFNLLFFAGSYLRFLKFDLR